MNDEILGEIADSLSENVKAIKKLNDSLNVLIEVVKRANF